MINGMIVLAFFKLNSVCLEMCVCSHLNNFYESKESNS